MKTLRQSLLTLSLAALSFGGVACNGAMSDDDALVGEASSALTVAEESGDATLDATGGETDAEAIAAADEAAVLPEAPADGDGVCDLGAMRQRVMHRYDANGDGRLGPAERQALKADLEARTGHPVLVSFGLRHRAPVIKRLRWVFDENNDGVLSTEERTALVDALEARCMKVRAKVVARFDANGDGSLDATERQAAKAALAARIEAARQAILAQYDADHSGTMELTEWQQFKADRIAAFRARRAAVVAQFDTDGDGTLSDAEKLALKQAIQQRIAEGRDDE